MKKFSLLFFLSLFANQIISQKTIEYSFTEKELTSNQGINCDEEYIFYVDSVNSAKVKLKATPSYFTAQLSTPDILKPIIGTGLEKFVPFGTPGEAIASMDIFDKKKNLELIQQMATDLYSLDDSNIDSYRKAAKDSLDKIIAIYNIQDEYKGNHLEPIQFDYKKDVSKNQKDSNLKNDVKTFQSLREIVKKEQKLIQYLTEWLRKKVMESKDTPSEEFYTLYELESIKSKDFSNSLDFIINSVSAKNYIKSAPFKTDKDFIDYDIKFVNALSKDTTHKESIELYVKNKFVFSFSTGLFLNQIIDKQYYIESNPDTTSKFNFIQPEDNPKYDLAFGALAHLSYKITSGFQSGINIGAAVSPFDGKTRYLSGVSFLFGRKQQLIFNVGYSFSKMNTLSTQLETDGDKTLIPKSMTTIPKFSKWEDSWYIGLTYNIIKTK